MWYEVQKLTRQGLNISQIRKETGLDRSTIRRYQKIKEDEFHEWIQHSRNLPKKLALYNNFVRDLLSNKPYLSAAQVEDRLKEYYDDLPKIHSKTVYNFVKAIRIQYEIPKPGKPTERVFEKLPEVDFGKEAQVDFGETWLQTKEGSRKKVHFFTMVLSRSRYKYVFFDERPFTSHTSSEAHHLAFAYFEGIPKEIIYDQDSVFLYNENLGDYLLTKEFSNFCKTQNFKVVFCRKADPQSKGKVENVVKYIKQNFLRGRTFININILNEQALAWLKRTGNAKVHSTTKLVPTKQWEEEKKHLLPIKTQNKNKQLRTYKVRKDNTVCYKSNFYSLPLGTYKDKDSEVILEILDKDLRLYTLQKELICTHKICNEKGHTVRNTDHSREKSKTLEVYQKEVLNIFDNMEIAKEYFEKLYKNKSRYYRDNLQYIIKNHQIYSEGNKQESILFCIENKIFNAKSLIDILNKKEEENKKAKEDLPEIKKLESKIKHIEEDKYNNVETSNIEQYEQILK